MLEALVPVVQIDYFFQSDDGRGLPCLVAVDRGSGMPFASQVTRKGNCAYAVKALSAFLLSVGHLRMILQHDQEPAIRNLAELTHEKVLQLNGAIRMTTRESPVDSHQSNGAAERGVRTVRGLARTLLQAVQRQSRCPC